LWIQVYSLVHIYFLLVSSIVKRSFFNRFENLIWIPNVIAFPVLLGLAGRHLNPSTFLAVPPASAVQIMSFGSVVASSNISWCTFTPDCGVYHDAEASTWVFLLYIGERKVLINNFHSFVLLVLANLRMKIFIYSYLGFLLPSVSHISLSHGTQQPSLFHKLQIKKQIAWNMVGAAFAAAAPGVPSWSTGFQDGNNLGGLIAAVLAPAGGFGKFLLVLIAVSASSACAPTIYSFGEYSLIWHCKIGYYSSKLFFIFIYFFNHKSG
jgi:purine-cytosine permease-like protein